VRWEGDSIVLVAGRHRLQAYLRLGMKVVDCVIFDGDETADLTVLERSEHIAEWIKLADIPKAQVEPSGKRHTGGRPDQGINDAVRNLGVERNDAQRAVRTSNLPDEAKTTARSLGLDDNQSALLAATRSADPVSTLHEIAKRRAVRPAPEEQAKRDPLTPLLDQVAAALSDLAPAVLEALTQDQRTFCSMLRQRLAGASA